MQTKFLSLTAAAIAAAASLMTAGCSQDQEAGENGTPDNNAIRFAANTEFSRAGEFTTNNLTAFNVYAYTGTDSFPTTFMDNVEVTKTGTNSWTYSPIKYWPANETVDFYAFAPSSWVGTDGPLKPVTYQSYPGDDDIIYAVCTDLKGNTGTANAQVVFNFRHALSKITVKMRSSNEDLTVKVSNVAMGNIKTKGNFLFPRATTSGTATAETTGKWEDQNTPATYMYHMSQSADDLITLTTTPATMGTENVPTGGSKYVIPQMLSYRSNGNGNDNYLAVMCSIYDTKSGDKLWPNANTPSENIVEGSTFGDGLLKFPLLTSSFTSWQPGVHYIYNLVINSNEEMDAIEFGNPTVDTYVDVTANYE